MTGILGLDLGSNYMGGQSGDIIHAAGTYLGYANSVIILAIIQQKDFRFYLASLSTYFRDGSQ